MHAADFCRLYDYHFALNRRLWDESVMALTDQQFTQKIDYSVGSIRNQMVHLMDIEGGWFEGLRGLPRRPFYNVVHWPTRAKIRTHWDGVETHIRAYLDALTDADLERELGDKKPLKYWQVLLHVLNHGTDHRAQTLAMLATHFPEVPTFPQDMAHFWWK